MAKKKDKKKQDSFFTPEQSQKMKKETDQFWNAIGQWIGHYAWIGIKKVYGVVKKKLKKNKQAFDMENFLRCAKWNTFLNLYGSAHGSIIGFLSTTWLAQSNKHFVLGPAPANRVDVGNEGKHADLLLCSDSTPIVVAEVESTVDKYNCKLETVESYLENQEEFQGLEFGLLFLLNWTGRRDTYTPHWKELKDSIKKTKHNIALVSFVKEHAELRFNEDLHPRLMEERGWYQWRYTSIDFWIHFGDQQIKSGNLWRKTDGSL